MDNVTLPCYLPLTLHMSHLSPSFLPLLCFLGNNVGSLLCCKNLILWAIFMKLVVLVFSVIAFRISCMKDPFLMMQIYCYKFSTLVLGISSLFIFVAVSWNHMVDLYGQTTLDFPPKFPVQKEALKNKYVTAVFPVGILTATMSLFGGIMFLSEISYLKIQSQVEAKSVSKVALQEA